ncbi:hypothetical protein ACNKHS_00265 [Shigella flexneri]
MEEALAVAADVGYPCMIRRSFTMGGTGGGIATTRKSLKKFASVASISPQPKRCD